MIEPRTALMYSGGLDSACAFFVLGMPDALYFGGDVNGPARYAGLGELMALKAHTRIVPGRIRALEFDFGPFMRTDPQRGQWTHPRHQLCAMLAWAEGYDRVLFAWCKDDNTGDALPRFKQKFEGAVDMPGFSVEFPVIQYSKAELIGKALEAGAPIEFLNLSHSCVVRGDKHCGKCVNCRQRRAAFIEAGHPEPEGTYLES